MLSDPNPMVCHHAAWALGEIGLAEPEVLAALHAACRHPDERVSREAQEALITIGRGPRPTDD
jgi:HEAT repeat protein